MMNRGRVIRGRVEYQVEYRKLGEFLSIKVEFLLESENNSVRFDSTTIRDIRLKCR